MSRVQIGRDNDEDDHRGDRAAMVSQGQRLASNWQSRSLVIEPFVNAGEADDLVLNTAGALAVAWSSPYVSVRVATSGAGPMVACGPRPGSWGIVLVVPGPERPEPMASHEVATEKRDDAGEEVGGVQARGGEERLNEARTACSAVAFHSMEGGVNDVVDLTVRWEDALAARDVSDWRELWMQPGTGVTTAERGTCAHALNTDPTFS